MPKIQFKSNAKPSFYAYPEPLQPPKKEEKEKVSTAILSITAKAKARTKKSKDDDTMDVDEKDQGTEKNSKKSVPESSQESNDKTEEKGEKDKNETENETKTKAVEPDFQMIDNPARVMPAQRKVLTLTTDCRYSSIKPVHVGGIIILKDSKSEEPEDLIEPLPASVATESEDEKEPDPPESFEYTEE